jgi:hypothetical protein
MSESTTTASVLDEVAAERERQNAKWGEQNHPNGTGPDEVSWTALMSKSKTYGMLATRAKQTTDDNAKVGLVTFADILLEEVFEAMAEEDQDKLRTELIQVAAVATQWVEAIDRATK